jgi:FkbM family methyltransferase
MNLDNQKILEELGKNKDYIVKIPDPITKKIICFNVTNRKTLVRAVTLFRKEPVTIDWIRTFKENEIFFDIGANIGQFTIFAGIVSKCKIFAFEPESNNFQGLNKNILINNLNQKIEAYPIGISDKTKFTKLYLDQFFTGSSFNSVDYEVDFSLNKKKFKLSQGIFCTSLNDLLEKWNFQIPNYLKIDVDGIESKIIEKSEKIISNKNLKSILIELNTKRKEDNLVVSNLKNFGFKIDSIQIKNALKENGFAEHLFYR